MYEKVRIFITAALAALFALVLLPVQGVAEYIGNGIGSRHDLHLSLAPVDPGIRAVTADPESRLVMRVVARTSSGEPAAGVRVDIRLERGRGTVSPETARTDSSGWALFTFTPGENRPGESLPSAASFLGGTDSGQKNNMASAQGGDGAVRLSATSAGAAQEAAFNLTLVRVPVVYVHGYGSSGSIFDLMKDYLNARGYSGEAPDYDSQAGVAASAKELKAYLRNLKSQYLSGGILASRFDLVAHSMGGLVARYYTCSSDYPASADVRKLIFLSVPHKGSPWASLGLAYYNDAGMRDLVPSGNLLAKELPSMQNGGLNSSIRTGNILDSGDEVVSADSAGLSEWNIRTEIFDVGKSSFSVDKLVSGDILNAPNHKKVLENSKVFDRVIGMLDGALPYPAKRN